MNGSIDRYEFMSMVTDNFDKCESDFELLEAKELMMKDLEEMLKQNVLGRKLV